MLHVLYIIINISCLRKRIGKCRCNLLQVPSLMRNHKKSERVVFLDHLVGVREAYIISLIQYFEDDFLWKVILKILNSGIILKTFTHAFLRVAIYKQNLLNADTSHELTKVQNLHYLHYYTCPDSDI